MTRTEVFIWGLGLLLLLSPNCVLLLSDSEDESVESDLGDVSPALKHGSILPPELIIKIQFNPQGNAGHGDIRHALTKKRKHIQKELKYDFRWVFHHQNIFDLPQPIYSNPNQNQTAPHTEKTATTRRIIQAIPLSVVNL